MPPRIGGYASTAVNRGTFKIGGREVDVTFVVQGQRAQGGSVALAVGGWANPARLGRLRAGRVGRSGGGADPVVRHDRLYIRDDLA